MKNTFLLISFDNNFTQKQLQSHLNKKEFSLVFLLKCVLRIFINLFFRNKNFLSFSKKRNSLLLENLNKNKAKIRIRGSPK